MAKRTALYETHLELKATMVDFAGYELPIQYPSGVIKEHLAVREEAGLFDVSHMGEAVVSGVNATAYLDKVLSNRISGMEGGRMRYALLLNEQGGTVDDLLVYCYNPERYMLVLNAANSEKDVAFLREYLIEGVSLEDISESVSQVALQGPKALEILATLMDANDIPKKYYAFTANTTIANQPCLLSRNGYTGEDGVEIYGGHAEIVAIYKALLQAGAKPCGLGARDTLRLEAGMPLYGHELGEELSAIEAGLGMFIKMDKEDFIGKSSLSDFVPAQKRVGLRMLGRGIAREGCKVLAEGREVGLVSSGTQLPFVKFAGAMAFVDEAFADIGTKLMVDVRGRQIEAEVVALPFYKKAK